MDVAPISGAERRKYLRFAPKLTAELQVPPKLRDSLGGNSVVTVRVMDLSEGGMGFFFPLAIDLGSFIKLRVLFPDMDDKLDVAGTVRRNIPPPPVAKDFIVGIEFADISHDIRKKVAIWRNWVTSTMVRKKTDEDRRELGLDGVSEIGK